MLKLVDTVKPWIMREDREKRRSERNDPKLVNEVENEAPPGKAGNSLLRDARRAAIS